MSKSKSKATDRSVRSTRGVSLWATVGSSPDFVRFGMTTLGISIIELVNRDGCGTTEDRALPDRGFPITA